VLYDLDELIALGHSVGVVFVRGNSRRMRRRGMACIVVLAALLSMPKPVLAFSCHQVGTVTYCDNGLTGQTIGSNTYWHAPTPPPPLLQPGQRQPLPVQRPFSATCRQFGAVTYCN
jgi:hypothetical protein